MKIYDSVHGFIRFNEIESTLIDAFPFQRLHYIHQLGIAYLVYPGGTHTRFEHSLGVMHVASLILDRIINEIPLKFDHEYWKQIVRLAALCHDLGHLPFSHTAEKVLLGKGGHEKWTLEVIKSHYLKPVWKMLKPDAVNDIIKISIGEKKLQEMGINLTFSPLEKVLCEVITGDFFGADRIDYLLRDAQCTGVAYGLIDYHQLIEMLRILPHKDELHLGIEENGIESCEALLLARHFMHRRVYQYSTAKAYAFHLARFMKKIYTQDQLNNLEQYLSMTDNEVLSMLSKSKDKDAQAIMTRNQRFKAFQITDMNEKDLQKFKKELHIPDDDIHWEFAKKTTQKMGFSFPVLKRNGSIVDGSSCSEILIPLGPSGWIYIAPEYESKLKITI